LLGNVISSRYDKQEMFEMEVIGHNEIHILCHVAVLYTIRLFRSVINLRFRFMYVSSWCGLIGTKCLIFSGSSLLYPSRRSVSQWELTVL